MFVSSGSPKAPKYPFVILGTTVFISVSVLGYVGILVLEMHLWQLTKKSMSGTFPYICPTRLPRLFQYISLSQSLFFTQYLMKYPCCKMSEIIAPWYPKLQEMHANLPLVPIRPAKRQFWKLTYDYSEILRTGVDYFER